MFIHNVFDTVVKGLLVNRVISICWLKNVVPEMEALECFRISLVQLSAIVGHQSVLIRKLNLQHYSYGGLLNEKLAL